MTPWALKFVCRGLAGNEVINKFLGESLSSFLENLITGIKPQIRILDFDLKAVYDKFQGKAPIRVGNRLVAADRDFVPDSIFRGSRDRKRLYHIGILVRDKCPA
jgi:hypothetical protein